MLTILWLPCLTFFLNFTSQVLDDCNNYVGTGGEDRAERRGGKKYLGTLNWMPNQLQYKLRKLNCIFSYDKSDKPLVTREQTSKIGLVVGGFFATPEYSYGHQIIWFFVF